jgi:toxin ParE1/3/4
MARYGNGISRLAIWPGCWQRQKVTSPKKRPGRYRTFFRSSGVPVQFRVEITTSAERDLGEIWDYIAQDNPGNACTFILKIEEQINSLEHSPERCPLIPENQILGTSYRHLIYGQYRTVFRISTDTIYILRIIHGARLLEELL